MMHEIHNSPSFTEIDALERIESKARFYMESGDYNDEQIEDKLWDYIGIMDSHPNEGIVFAYDALTYTEVHAAIKRARIAHEKQFKGAL